MIVNVAFGLGSNAGNRLNNINSAVREICLLTGFNFLGRSSVYETDPWGYKNQNKFLNCVLVCLSRHSPSVILGRIQDIERRIGRVMRKKWYPREIDIDILFYDVKILKYRSLRIPHAQIQNRNFVLVPLLELMPGFIHPGLNKSIRTLYKNSNDNGKVIFYRKEM